MIDEVEFVDVLSTNSDINEEPTTLAIKMEQGEDMVSIFSNVMIHF
jgi:hypothetical protein